MAEKMPTLAPEYPHQGKDAVLQAVNPLHILHAEVFCRRVSQLPRVCRPFLLKTTAFRVIMRFNWISSGVAAASLLAFSALPAAARECLLSELRWGTRAGW